MHSCINNQNYFLFLVVRLFLILSLHTHSSHFVVIDKNQFQEMQDGKTMKDIKPNSGFNILVVEDDMINRILLGKIFEKLGLIATMTNNGQEAFDAFDSKFYDIDRKSVV